MLALSIQELGFQKSTLYVLAWAQWHFSVSKGGVREKRYKIPFSGTGYRMRPKHQDLELNHARWQEVTGQSPGTDKKNIFFFSSLAVCECVGARGG